MKKTKLALFHSLIALLLCVSMFVGTTFAWFTDEVTSTNNIIQSGTLDVKLEWKDKTADDWREVTDSKEPIFNYTLWEPGYTQVKYVKITNAGNLAFKFRLNIVPNADFSKNDANLADVIDVYMLPADVEPTRENIAGYRVGTLTELMTNSTGAANGVMLPAGSNQTIAGALTGEATYCIVLKMQETAGNEYQDKSVGNGFSLQLLATQYTYEQDSFDGSYDENAAADFFPGFQGGTAGMAVNVNDQGLTTAAVDMAGGDVSAVIPAGVLLADGVNSLALSVTVKDASDANIQLNESEKMSPLDVHIEGVSADNTVPMLITLEQYLTTGINTGALKLYHVENGTPVAMTQVANPTNHNEFSYDPLTGNVTLALASFSEVAVIADTNNPWDGSSQTFNQDTDGNYLIANAGQLAYFRDVVDGKTKVEGLDPTFAGKTVKLTNNIYLDKKNFDPIGWGYANASHNRGGADGMVFRGTFDGNNKTIFDLYQNGWDLGYEYTNCGMGLFAAAYGATFKDLTISGADVKVECVEIGVLVGLSQGSCTYENIEIHNSKVANYQRATGGLIGEVSGDGTTTITNVTIGSDVVVGSLWGDFDAPCGGVIGARWDDQGANPQIVMSYVEVGCRMDVYNDITSAYQWHAYRRAGMLIGNTELTDPNDAHKAAAPFLTCSNVNVYYGDWVNYTYCEFSNHNPRYPWVRTQAGENCTAFSNPRWGVPNDANNNLVTDMNHKHQTGDECNVSRPFGQLYGGGQGVYGKDTHPGVEIINYKYSITYINDGQVLDIIYITDNTKEKAVANDQAQKLVLEWAKHNIQGGTIAFGGWMNAASIKLTEIPENNTKNIVLYPYFNSPYTASFVDQQGRILAWCFFNDADVSRLQDAFSTATKNLPNPGEDFELINWVIRGTNLNDGTVKVNLDKDNPDWSAFKGYKDVTITPRYRYKGADLIEVYDELTGEIDHYEVKGYTDGIGSTLVEIPGFVNGAPVTTINADAFSSYDDLHSVRIPGSITEINSQAFSADTPDVWYDTETWGDQRDTITMYFDGDSNIWNAAMELYNSGSRTGLLKQNWDYMMGESSCVFFLDANGKVDLSKGYWELAKTNNKFVWQFHDHTYGSNSGCSNEHNNKTDYTADCKCDLGTHPRPDKEYWTTTTEATTTE